MIGTRRIIFAGIISYRISSRKNLTETIAVTQVKI